jgi:hypothetical protein
MNGKTNFLCFKLIFISKITSKGNTFAVLFEKKLINKKVTEMLYEILICLSEDFLIFLLFR